MPFSGLASKNGSWTVDDDRLARTIEILGNFPPELLRKGNRTAEFFNTDGMPFFETRSANIIFSQFY